MWKQTIFLQFLICFPRLFAMYLPNNTDYFIQKSNNNNTMLNTISSDKNGPQMEKLKINNRTNLALTTVLIMGSAGKSQ